MTDIFQSVVLHFIVFVSLGMLYFDETEFRSIAIYY